MVDDAAFSLRTVVAPPLNRLIADLPDSLRDAEQAALHIPDERDDALHLLVTPEPIDPEQPPPGVGEWLDRFIAYHLQWRSKVPALLRIDAAKWDGEVLDADELDMANPLAPIEFRLLRLLNADRSSLGAICRARADTDEAEPVAVGIDPDGFDIRARIGVVRCHAGDLDLSPEHAEASIKRMIEEASA